MDLLDEIFEISYNIQIDHKKKISDYMSNIKIENKEDPDATIKYLGEYKKISKETLEKTLIKYENKLYELGVNEEDFLYYKTILELELKISNDYLDLISRNKDSKGYVLKFTDYYVTFKPNIIAYTIINDKFSKQVQQSLNKLKNFYINSKDIDTFLNKGYAYGLKLLEDYINLSLKVASTYGIYNLNKERLLNYKGDLYKRFSSANKIVYSRDSAFNIWQESILIIQKKRQEIMNVAQNERNYREQRKANRTRIIGGGFGLAGATKGMIEAGAINTITGITHDIFNFLGNISTNINENKNKKDLYQNPIVLESLLLSLNQAIQTIKKELYITLNLNNYCNKSQEEQCNIIINNINNNIIPKPKIKEALAQAFILNPFNMEIYRIYLNELGNRGDLLSIIAKFFHIENDIHYLKQKAFLKAIKNSNDIQKKDAIIEAIHGSKHIIEEYIKDDINIFIKDFKIIKNINYEIRINLPNENSLYDVKKLPKDKLTNELYDLYDLYKIEHNYFIHKGCIINEIANVLTKDLIQKVIKSDTKYVIPKSKYFNSDITEIELDEGIIMIDCFAFANCRNLETVKFPSSLKYISAFAFANCSKLKNIILPEGFYGIDMGAFYNCSSLRNIKFPESLRVIKRLAFKNVYISEINLPNRLDEYAIDSIYAGKIIMPSIIEKITGNANLVRDTSTHYDVDNSNKILEPSSKLTQYFKEVDLWDRTLIFDYDRLQKEIENAKNIAPNPALLICIGLTVLNFTIIAKHTFKNFNDFYIKKINISEEIRLIDDEAFFNADISNICFAENSNIKKIASRAFYNCKELTSFENGLPFGLETIGDEAFVGCDNLKEIIIPKTVKNIGNNIFDNPNIVIICEPGSPIYDYCKKNNLQISELEKNVTLSLPETKEEVKENIVEISSNNKEKITSDTTNDKFQVDLWDSLKNNEDEISTFERYRKSADSGNIWSKYIIATCYSIGYGTKKDENLATKYYKESAELGNTFAQQKLDEYFKFKHYREAADFDDIWSKYIIAMCYSIGYGTPKDQKLAIKYYKESAELGNTFAQQKLDEYYGIKNNVEKETVSIINDKNNIKSEINKKPSLQNEEEKIIINDKEIDSNVKNEDKNNKKKKRLDWRILIITILIAKFILGLDSFTSTLIGLVIAFIVKWYKNK